MRVIGRRNLPSLGLRWPSLSEIYASVDAARRAPRFGKRGVYRYRSHAEANAEMERWTVDGMVERALELDQGPRL